jgi:hypothetical protein
VLNIKQSTAKRAVFKAYLTSDHVSPATGKTIAITISKNGGAFGNPNAGATNATAISSGWYYVDLDTTDTNTVGPLAVRGAEGTIDDVGILFEVTADFATLDGKLDTIDNFLDTEIGAIITSLGTLDTKIDTIDNFLDTEIGSIITSLATIDGKIDVIDNLLDTEVAQIIADIAALNDISVNDILDQVNGVETGLTPRQALRLICSTTGALMSGGGTGTETFRNAVANSANRVIATVDASGNRTAIIYNL